MWRSLLYTGYRGFKCGDITKEYSLDFRRYNWSGLLLEKRWEISAGSFFLTAHSNRVKKEMHEFCIPAGSPPKHFGSFFSINFPRLQVRISLPTNVKPLWQRYLALHKPVCIAMMLFFGGLFFSLRRRSMHFLSQSIKKVKYKKMSFCSTLYHHININVRNPDWSERNISHKHHLHIQSGMVDLIPFHLRKITFLIELLGKYVKH